MARGGKRPDSGRPSVYPDGPAHWTNIPLPGKVARFLIDRERTLLRDIIIAAVRAQYPQAPWEDTK